jgi:LuxR family transcriptional regulator, maltose regulon positive regulatory protein
MLILDDYHAITEQAIHDSLFTLLERLPQQAHMVLSTRADPHAPGASTGA